VIGGDVPVIDAVLHGFNFRTEITGAAPGRLHEACHLAYSPRGGDYERYLLPRERYEREFTAPEVVSCVFAESQTDIGVFHHIRGMGRPGRLDDVGELSPLAIGREMRELAPGRVLIYAGLSNPWDTPRALEEIDWLVEEVGVAGLKFYPSDWDSKVRSMREFYLDDQSIAFPLIERAQQRGIKVIAVHKAMGSRLKVFGVADFEDAARTFPAMQFEIVHAGFAFVEDTVRLAGFPNIWLNLEGTSGLLAAAPRRFAEVMGQFLRAGMAEPDAQDRILWGTGAMFLHPQPLLERFWAFQIPQDLIDGYGYPQLDERLKRKILAENFARMHGLDLAAMLAPIQDDRFAAGQRTGELTPPWSLVP
jgi:predicted TIM-barrel fold metal-dependent hydrolase